MQPHSTIGLTMVALGVAASMGSAQVSLVSQTRMVHVGSGYECQVPFRQPCSGGNSHNFMAPDFNPFSVSDTIQQVYGSAAGQYDSTLTPNHIHVTSSDHVLVDIPLSHITDVSSVEATTQVTLDAASLMRYRLTASGSASATNLPYSLSYADMTLAAGAVTMVSLHLSTHGPTTLSADMRGNLVPRQYQLTVHTRPLVTNIEYTLRSEDLFSTQLDFVVSCPADFNVDGQTDSSDFFDYLSSFFSQAQEADYDGDGMVTSADFFQFIGFFFAGC